MEGFLLFNCVILWCFLIALHSKVSNLKKDVASIKTALKEKGFDLRSEFEKSLDHIGIETANNNVETVEVIHSAEDEESIEERVEIESVEAVQENIEEKDSSANIEKLFLGNVFNKIGAVILVIAFCIFVKIVSDNFVFTPAMRIGIGYVLGLGLCGLSLKMHKDKFINYAEVLLGISFSILFVTMYCSAMLYNMINAPTMCAIAALVLYGSYFIAQKYNSFSTIAIGLVGAYICPTFIKDSPISLLLIFLLFVNAITLVYTFKNPKKNMLDYVNVFLVSATVLDKSLEPSGAFILSLFYLIYLTKHFMENYSLENKNNTLLYTAQIVFPGIIIANDYSYNIELVRWYMLAYTVFALVLYMILRKLEKRNDAYLYSSMITLLGLVLLLERNVVVLSGCAVLSVALSWLSNKFKIMGLCKWGYSFGLYSILLAFIVKPEWFENLPAWLSGVALLLLIPIVSAVGSYYIAKKADDAQVATVYKFISITLGYYAFAHALVTVLQSQFANLNNSTCSALVYASVGLLYFLNAICARDREKPGLLEYSAYCVYGVSLLTLLACPPQYDCLPFCNICTLVAVLGIAVTVLINKIVPKTIYPYVATLLGAWTVAVNALNAVEYDRFIAIAVSISLAVYCGAILLLGIIKNIRACKLVGIGLAIFIVLRIFIIDMVNAELIHKLLGFLILGIMLMVVSYIYTKKKN